MDVSYEKNTDVDCRTPLQICVNKLILLQTLNVAINMYFIV